MNPRGAAAQRFLRTSLGPEIAGGDPAHDECASLDFESDDFDSVYFGWELARCAPGLESDERGALAAIAACCLASIRAGSTRLPISGPSFVAALGAVGASHAQDAARALIDRARGSAHPISAVIGRPGERRPLILEGDWLYAERMYVLENRFCARIQARLSPAPSDPRASPLDREPRVGREAWNDARGLARALQAVASSGHLTDEQTSAVRQALRSRLALIRGGPGTGKTTAVVALIRAIAWLGIPIEGVAVAAPTGKAAARISEAIAYGLSSTEHDLSNVAMRAFVPSPLTLHRLLGWSPRSGHFAHHENDPLPHRLVIVDEASMIDLAMMDRLLRALRPDARLVLLGDADQLPSVEAGAVFRDLCTALGGSRLTTNLRVASDASARTIVTAAEAVNSGNLDALAAGSVERRHRPADVAFGGVEHLAAAWSMVEPDVLERWWARIADERFTKLIACRYRTTDGRIAPSDTADLRALFAHHARGRILCATRLARFATSADAINAWLVDRLRQPQRQGETLPVGTPFVLQRNDYARGLYNGDQGVVVLAETANGLRPMAALARGDRFEALPLESLPDLAPAFAMTVHKAQGSEFEDVLLVLPERDMTLLTRELVYTALSRARRSVLIVGEAALLARAIERTTVRYSGIAERLGAARKRNAH
ncbi:MAG TPA: exodeoxyribonuclease V subunit alpha [Polyangiaceae bacterium]|nr:exodeoxyribonuclease V subunit alpha [Polyangiaceae bacterium]